MVLCCSRKAVSKFTQTRMEKMEFLKVLVKAVLPRSVLEWTRLRRLHQLRITNSSRSTQEVFSAIYANNMWGGGAGTFCSGSGSQLEVARPYCEMVKKFVSDHGVKSVLDIGCGDFSVGQNLQVTGIKYTGVDIVQSLIERNAKLFGSDSIDFRCLNVIEDQLPSADLVLVRQVLQHLSNQQIKKVLNKLHGYRYVMVTEHYPAPSVKTVHNIDKPHGGDTRIPDNSAVYLDHPPFNVQGARTVLEVPASRWLAHDGETIKTVLITKNA